MMIMQMTVNATTASPPFLSCGMNPDGRLEPKTQLVLLWGPPGQEGMGLLRDSSSLPGAFSLDWYGLRAEEWECRGKDTQKFQTLPYPPTGAYHFSCGGVDYWTKHPMTQGEKDRLRTLSTARKKRSRGRKR